MTIRQIKAKTLYGDYTVLGQMLGITPDAAKKRFLRGDASASAALIKIIENRERLIREANN